MEAKKNPSRDIHRMYPITLLSGFCASVGIVIVVFELQFKSEKLLLDDFDDPWEDAMTLLDPTINEIKPEPVYQVRTQKKVTVVPTEIELAPGPEEAEQTLKLDDPFEPAADPVPAGPFEPATDDAVLAPEVAPLPEGGFDGFYKLLRKELRYPRRAVQAGVGGRVFVEFVVSTEGIVTSPRVVKGIGYGCDEEAVRVISKVRWSAGKQGGRPVKVRLILPIYFALN